MVVEESQNPSEDADLHVCRSCGEGVKTLVSAGKCPKCGGRMADSTVPHD